MLAFGSGAVESSVRRVVNRRLKGNSIYGLEDHAEASGLDTPCNIMSRGSSWHRSALAMLNRSIRPKTSRGELDPQDPTDESASVLLGRIRAEPATTETPRKKETRSHLRVSCI